MNISNRRNGAIFFLLFACLLSFSSTAWAEEEEGKNARIYKYYYQYGSGLCAKGQYAYSFDYLIKIPKTSEFFEKSQGCVQAYYDLMSGKKVTPPKIEFIPKPEDLNKKRELEKKKIAEENKKRELEKKKIAEENKKRELEKKKIALKERMRKIAEKAAIDARKKEEVKRKRLAEEQHKKEIAKMREEEEERIARENKRPSAIAIPKMHQDVSNKSFELEQPDPFFPFTSTNVKDTNRDRKTDFWIFINNGKPIRTEADSNYDGKVDVWGIFDDNGRLIVGKKDTNFDGKIDKVNYYKNGELLRVASDANFDGVLDWWQYYEHGVAVKSVQDKSFKKF